MSESFVLLLGLMLGFCGKLKQGKFHGMQSESNCITATKAWLRSPWREVEHRMRLLLWRTHYSKCCSKHTQSSPMRLFMVLNLKVLSSSHAAALPHHGQGNLGTHAARSQVLLKVGAPRKHTLEQGDQCWLSRLACLPSSTLAPQRCLLSQPTTSCSFASAHMVSSISRGTCCKIWLHVFSMSYPKNIFFIF